ncbi:zinc finger protein 641-like isoform X2 [Trachemys scripta elegans]|uniref:zinc finger protein 641-like isoform X2 n=1 Tax=Trachemys scripta elegans TaxID=31138 RepID=UPI001554A507|nr:zinc finger protein 641-like isoform X2 [Trachemys scripta elegans]
MGKGNGCREAGAGFPIPKPDMISQMEQGEEPWTPDHQSSEERQILRNIRAGEGTVSENKEENPQQEGLEQVEPRGIVSGRFEGNISQNPEHEDAHESQHRPGFSKETTQGRDRL